MFACITGLLAMKNLHSLFNLGKIISPSGKKDHLLEGIGSLEHPSSNGDRRLKSILLNFLRFGGGMEENDFTADGFSPFEEHCDVQEEGGWLMKICSEKSAIPRKKRSARVGIFNEERMMGESPLEFLASVASKYSELNARLPVKKRKINFFLSTEENRKKMKTSLNSMANEAMALKKERDEFGVFDENSLSVASILWELSQKLPLKKIKCEFLSPVAEIPKSNRRKKTQNSKASKEKPLKKTMEKKQELKPPILKVPPMAEALAGKIRGMGGERVELVIQKQLSHTDINSANSRLSIPCNKKRTDFLSETEKTILSQHMPNSKTMRGIDVLVIDPRLEEMKLCLKRWKMKNIFVYNLIENWNTLVKQNNLEAGDTILLWVFRVKERSGRGLSDLCFALVKLEEDNNGGDDDTVSSTSTSTVTTLAK